MTLTSFDNMSEQDGIDLVAGFLGGLNAEPAGPLKRVLVAMLPEYDDAGVLQRMTCITVPTEDPGSLAGGLGELMEAAAQITAERIRVYDADLAALREPTVVEKGP